MLKEILQWQNPRWNSTPVNYIQSSSGDRGNCINWKTFSKSFALRLVINQTVVLSLY